MAAVDGELRSRSEEKVEANAKACNFFSSQN